MIAIGIGIPLQWLVRARVAVVVTTVALQSDDSNWYEVRVLDRFSAGAWRPTFRIGATPVAAGPNAYLVVENETTTARHRFRLVTRAGKQTIRVEAGTTVEAAVGPAAWTVGSGRQYGLVLATTSGAARWRLRRL